MERFSRLLQCISGPRLYYLKWFNEDGDVEPVSYNCYKNIWERAADFILDSYGWFIATVQYLSPFILISVYRYGNESAYITSLNKKMIFYFVAVYFVAFYTRGFARYCTDEYRKFIAEFTDANIDFTLRRSFLQKYDFEFQKMNPDFQSNKTCHLKGTEIPFSSLLTLPLHYTLKVWLARPLIYPGSTYLINYLLGSQLDNGRVRLMLSGNSARRLKLRTVDGSDIDSVFVDKRHTSNPNGNYLVITSEGNSGFYEVGCFELPYRMGYSVIGWNHPGFQHSTGKPSDWHDANAAEAVYQYATEVLRFPPDRIILYGWSIGGFPVCYLAGTHGNIGGVILDSTFGSLIPLAKSRMAEVLGTITEAQCTRFFNLDNEYYLKKYRGPIRIIRRTRDEVIADDLRDPLTNHGNTLINSILNQRYPGIFADTQVETYLITWLSSTDFESRIASLPKWNPSECQRILNDYKGDKESFGSDLDAPTKVMVAYYIFSNIFDDFESGHNGPLDSTLFKLPWSDSFVRMDT